MTTPTLDALLRKLDQTQSTLFDMVRAMPDDQLRYHPQPGIWSVKQQLVHVVSAERLWAGWILQSLAMLDAEVGPIPTNDPWPGLDTADQRPLDDLLADITTARAAALIWPSQLGEAELERTARHLTLGKLSVLRMLGALYGHQQMHIDQIAGREVQFPESFRPDWRLAA